MMKMTRAAPCGEKRGESEEERERKSEREEERERERGRERELPVCTRIESLPTLRIRMAL